MGNALYSDLASVCHLFYKQYFPHQKIAHRLDKILKKHDCRKIVFIGGLIYVADILRRKGYKITFVDYTREMLEEARPVLGDVPSFVSDMRFLSLGGKYDSVLAIGRSFTYMYDDKDALKTLNAFRHHLKPGGIIIIDNYETGKIDKGNYFNGALKTNKRRMAIERISTIRREQKEPAIYRWNCTYLKTAGGKLESYADNGHLLRSFSKDKIKKLIERSGLNFLSHYPNFERKSFISVGKNKLSLSR